MTITLTQLEKEHNVNKVHDALIAAGLVPTHVESDEEESRFTFDDSVDPGDVQDVFDAYVFVEPVPVDVRVSPELSFTVEVSLEPAGELTFTGLPSLYALTGAIAHTPSTDLSGMTDITVAVRPAGSLSSVADFAGGVVNQLDGATVPGVSATVGANNILSGDLAVAVLTPAESSATAKFTIFVQDLS
jgi:hypothetical protein